VSHDRDQPLSSITMASGLLSESAKETAEKRLAHRIRSSATRMARLIDQILDFARIRAGLSFDLRLEPADVHQICVAAVEELRVGSPDREITLSVEGQGEARCDSDRIAQVLSNLIGNAVQHGTPGPISVTVRDAAPDAVAIEIHNFGPPIPMAAQASIFDAFQRQTTADGRPSKSVGLGLFIANQIVRAHGGSLAVRSPDRGGSTFTVLLPRGVADASQRDLQLAPPPLY
jgi:signal transduction histidine kinase